jgi:hypothetical protein
MFRLAGGYKPAGHQQEFRFAQAHEAWRYGLQIETEHQTELETWLNGLITWVDAQLV